MSLNVAIAELLDESSPWKRQRAPLSPANVTVTGFIGDLQFYGPKHPRALSTLFVAINLLTPREAQYYWQKSPGVATVWLCLASDMRFSPIHHSIVREVLKQAVGGWLIIHDTSRYVFLLSTTEVSNHYKKAIDKNVRCYLWGLLTWNNESIKMLSGTDRRLLNRARPQKTVKIWISFGWV